MKSGIGFAVAMLFLSFTASAATRRPTLPPRVDQSDSSNNAFATDLYAQFASTDGNFFFSPTSIQMALAITWGGANGQTADEMAKALHFDPAETHRRLSAFAAEINSGAKAGGYELASSNALWLDKGFPFDRDYISFVRKSYKAKLDVADFAGDSAGSRKAINDWVAEQTHDRIKELMPEGSVDRDTRLVLANAIYFNGKWTHTFDKNLTLEQDFRTASGKKVKTSLMMQRGHFRYGEDEAVQVLEIPYGNDQLCMRIFLPRKANGLGALERRMTAPRLAVLAEKLRQEDVMLYLPRFKIEAQLPLTDALQAMGMKLAFEPGKADFTAMSPQGGLYISAVLHNAFIKVDEEGTEAAAATGVAGVLFGGGGGVAPQPIEFKADHPFVFAIVHRKTDTMLFMGRLTNP